MQNILEQYHIDFLQREFRLIEAQTCIRFVERTTEVDFVEIVSDGGCWSWLGRLGGMQELSMDIDGCFWDGTGVHEAIHALGFHHMHNDIDRDRYVRIMWENIIPPFEDQFEMVNPVWYDNFGTPYDIISVMHYPRFVFFFHCSQKILNVDLI